MTSLAANGDAATRNSFRYHLPVHYGQHDHNPFTTPTCITAGS